ncbi:MAG: hypothetical protein QOG23_4039 [Blastocatellia bacterium]|nr:hypothetical protein [Blastocatellia bacterium]
MSRCLSSVRISVNVAEVFHNFAQVSQEQFILHRFLHDLEPDVRSIVLLSLNIQLRDPIQQSLLI